MDGDGLGTGILGPLDDLDDIDRVVIPADARLDHDRYADGLDGSAHRLVEPGQVAQEGRATTPSDDLRYRTAEVDVHHLGAAALQFGGALGHHGDVVAVDLGCQQADAGSPVDLGVAEVQQPLDAFTRLVYEPAIDELHAHESGAELGADQAEDPVADTGHWRQGEDGHTWAQGSQRVGADMEGGIGARLCRSDLDPRGLERVRDRHGLNYAPSSRR